MKPLVLNADLQFWFNRHNVEVDRAREQYERLPIAAVAADWCTGCCWPRAQRRCEDCRAVMRMRELRAKENRKPK